MDVFFLIFIFFTIFVLCSMCGFCCKNKDEGAIFSTPVVVTSATHQPPGASYPIQTNQTIIVDQSPPYPAQPTMPMPGYQQNAPYPMQQQQPVAPYPPMNAAPYPPPHAAAAAPYPSPQAPQNMYPPSYNEAVNQVHNQEGYQKQSPYNPSY